MIRILLAATALTAAALAAPAAAAPTVVQASAPGAGQWGTIQFSFGGGALAMDALARNWTGGPTGAGIEDIYLTLLADDGSSLLNFTGAYITANDDSYSTFADGSVHPYDSYLSTTLAAGDYLLTISRCCQAFRSTSNSVATGSGIGVNRDFQITFSSAVDVTAINRVAVADVPEPAALALFGMGLLGLAGLRRRRV